MGKRHPGVTYLGETKGERTYRIRTEVRNPKTGRAHEIDRRVTARDAAHASEILASERASWLSKRTRGADVRRRLGEAMTAWLEEKRGQVKPSTASTYGSAVTSWSAVLGDYWIDAVEPRDVRGALAGWREGGDASETVAGRLRVLHTFAVEERCARIVEGVSVRRDVREDERIEDEGRGLSLDELRAFLAAGPDAKKRKQGEERIASWDRAWALVATMAWTGLRFGEASALEWQDVDLDAGTIRVRRAQWRGSVGHVKASCSKRTIVIPDELVDVLREHRHAMLSGQQRGVSLPLVFPSRRTGARYVTNTHARKAIACVCTAAGIDLDGRPTVHMLRHTWTNALRQVVTSEIVCRALVGHADEESTERYSNVGMSEKRSAVAGVVRMVRGGEK
jgi:integrase